MHTAIPVEEAGIGDFVQVWAQAHGGHRIGEIKAITLQGKFVVHIQESAGAKPKKRKTKADADMEVLPQSVKAAFRTVVAPAT